jgi:hypothetical protein
VIYDFYQLQQLLNLLLLGAHQCLLRGRLLLLLLLFQQLQLPVLLPMFPRLQLPQYLLVLLLLMWLFPQQQPYLTAIQMA